MSSRRYTLILADRATGVVRRFSISVRGTLLTALALLFVPLVLLVGARWSASVETAQLRATNRVLEMENDSYRAATGELTTQISSLQAVVNELGDRAKVDPAAAAAMAKLPPMVRNRALGGAPVARDATRQLLSAVTAPENTFGVLRELLGSLEDRLDLVRTDVERWQALANATPSIWPVVGWLTDSYGSRSDPFNGSADFHEGLDISADKGDPVYATADGTVKSAAWLGDYGNLVEVVHEFGMTTRYAHLSAFAVRAGAQVRRGDLLGYVGMTGRATAPHLHYEVRAAGRAMNPLSLLTRTPRR
jgi:murein DD-endopeptidase MepM/ murein hydrolase activator NlpD